MLKNIIKNIILINQILNVKGFLISEGQNILYNKNLRKSTNILNIKARFSNDISRRNLLYLSPLVLNPKIVFANDNNEIKKIAVFGASGYTGGDTIRNLLNKKNKMACY